MRLRGAVSIIAAFTRPQARFSRMASLAHSDDDAPKKKRVSGYILFGKAERENVKTELEASAEPDTKVKSTEVMKRLGELWKELPEATRDEWNAKAKELAA